MAFKNLYPFTPPYMGSQGVGDDWQGGILAFLGPWLEYHYDIGNSSGTLAPVSNGPL